MQPTKKSIASLEEELQAVGQELRGTQEMLAHVLLKIGEPVVVTMEDLERGFPDNVGVLIEEDLEKKEFVFRLETREPDETEA